MIAFPGAYSDYFDLVDKHGIEFHREPVGIADNDISRSRMPMQGDR
jgi:hypothetical protein